MKSVVTRALIIAPFLAPSAYAQSNTAAENSTLRTEVEALRARVDQLEGSSAEHSSATDRLSVSGDFRFRHETIDDEASTKRSRERIRARLNVNSVLGDDLTVGFTLATGASNPVSANQSLDGGFSRKDIGFDRAFFAWDINDDLKLRGGKMGNPLFRPAGHHLIFDSDLNPEGLALSYDKGQVFANIGGFVVEERGGSEDAILYALQGGYRAMIGAETELTVGASILNYSGTQGFEPFYLGEPQGNSVDGFGNLIYDYDLVELFAQAELEAGEQPLRLFLDYVENTDVDVQNSGYAVGARWRRASAPGSWDVSWAYEVLEADAVIATFTDSDFIGGGTDGEGHVFKATYVLRDNVQLNGTYFLNERGEAAGNKRDYDRLQLDISFRF
jgi:hypothetical protein